MPLIRPSALREAFLECHAEGHQWGPSTVIGGSDPGARPPLGMFDAVGRHRTCTSCTSQRTRWYTRSGEVINKYDYADGYLHKKASPDDDAAPTRQDWRQQLVVKLFDDLGKPRSKRRTAAS